MVAENKLIHPYLIAIALMNPTDDITEYNNES